MARFILYLYPAISLHSVLVECVCIWNMFSDTRLEIDFQSIAECGDFSDTPMADSKHLVKVFLVLENI